MRRVEFQIVLLLVLLALAVSGCKVETKAPAPSDQTVTSDIQAQLFQDPVLKTRDIQVNTAKGVVTLAGTVDSQQEKAAVAGIANHESGVKQVVDQLAVANPAQAEAATPAQAARKASTRKAARRRHHPKSEEVAAVTPPASPEQEPAAASAESNPAPPAPAPVIDQPPPPAAPTPPPTVTIPAGTVITVRMIDSVDSTTSQPGQEFAGSLATPVVVGSSVVIPKNSSASVRLVTANNSGRLEGSAQLALELHSLTVNGSTYHVQSGTYTQNGASRGRRTGEAVGGGGLLGGLIGAIAGGGKGAAIGAGVGAASGGGIEAASKRGQVKVPSEAKISFTLKAPLIVPVTQ